MTRKDYWTVAEALGRTLADTTLPVMGGTLSNRSAKDFADNMARELKASNPNFNSDIFVSRAMGTRAIILGIKL